MLYRAGRRAPHRERYAWVRGLKRAGEAPGEIAGHLSSPFQHLSAPILAPMRPLAGTEREFRILSSAIRRMISPAGESICLLIKVLADANGKVVTYETPSLVSVFRYFAPDMKFKSSRRANRGTHYRKIRLLFPNTQELYRPIHFLLTNEFCLPVLETGGALYST